MTDDFINVARERLQYIDSHREELVAAWLAKTGISPDEAVLVQEGDTLNWRVWVEAKADRCSTHRHEIAELKEHVRELQKAFHKVNAIIDSILTL